MKPQYPLCRQWLLPAIASCAISLTVERAALAQEGPPPPPSSQSPSSQSETPPGLPAPADGATDTPAASDPRSGTPSQDEFVVLDSGPVHEAFAEPITLNAEPDVVVTRQPPDPIEELPPETRPQGDNVQWIPGYWMWVEDDDDFIWVSGVWRDIPPGQQWMPGYWTQVEGGYRWTHGFWSPVGSQELAYLPPPPESLDTGPVSPRPGDEYVYVPGCWIWNDVRYVWRPGFWHPCPVDWVWVPAHYCWTPRGYVFLRGYWDYPLVRRGLLFAPIRFYRPIYLAAGFRYSPFYWVNVSRLTFGLFVSPLRGHYFFGNYYGPRYLTAGYYPWFQYHNRRFGYDPLFAYQSAYYRRTGGGDRWLAELRSDYDRRARQFADQSPGPRGFRPGDELNLGRVRGDGPDRDAAPRFVQNIREIDSERVTRLNPQERLRAVEQDAARLNTARRQREAIEAKGPPLDRGIGRSDARDIGRGGVDDRFGRTTGPDRSALPDRGDLPNRSALPNRGDLQNRGGRSLPDSARTPIDRSARPDRIGGTSAPSEFRNFDRAQSPRSRTGEPGPDPRAGSPSFRGQSPTDAARTPRTGPPQLESPPRSRQLSPGAEGSPFQFSPRQERSVPQANRSVPQLNQSAPQLNRSVPQLNQSAPQLNRSAPQLNRSSPPINRGPSLPNANFGSRSFSSPPRQSVGPPQRSPNFGGGSGSAFRGAPSFRPPASGGGGFNRGGGAISRGGAGGGGSAFSGGRGGGPSRGGRGR